MLLWLFLFVVTAFALGEGGNAGGRKPATSMDGGGCGCFRRFFGPFWNSWKRERCRLSRYDSGSNARGENIDGDSISTMRQGSIRISPRRRGGVVVPFWFASCLVSVLSSRPGCGMPSLGRRRWCLAFVILVLAILVALECSLA